MLYARLVVICFAWFYGFDRCVSFASHVLFAFVLFCCVCSCVRCAFCLSLSLFCDIV